jgi:D-sedoheptulose 7-phosphate isomerase
LTAVSADALAARTASNRAFFSEVAEPLARLCHAMSERFVRGGRLIAVGATPVARSDARHVAVEFVHPVIVGKRALPAIALAAEGGDVGAQLELVAEPDDIVMAFGSVPLSVARARGCLTIAFAPTGAEWELVPETGDPFVAQELAETAYHVLWELVHVFLEHRGRAHDAGASSFLYPFLAEGADDLESVVADVRASILMKAEETGALREQTLTEGAGALAGAAEALRGGGRLLALGNGGSATDAMDVVADFHGRGLRALDLTEDAAILTALANDIGVEAIFARQVIAHGREGDVLLAISTSGGSANVIAALEEARRRGLVTVALVGYDGGRIGAEGLADRVVVTRSQNIPRIQEAQASAYHLLLELVCA